MIRGQRALTFVIVAALALVAVPTALGAKPSRTVIGYEVLNDLYAFVAPPGELCSFAVQGAPDENAWSAITEFTDGRIQTIGHANPTLTNVDTGDTFVNVSRYKATDTLDPETNEVFVEISGRIFIGFLEGDEGPFGEVGEDGLLASVIGHQQFTVDLDTNVVTSYSLDGTATDICPLISG